MARIPGNYDATRLQEVNIALSSIYANDRLNTRIDRDTPIFNSVWGDQSIRFGAEIMAPLMNVRDCRQVKATFMLSCDLSVQDCTTSCDIGEGPEHCSDSVYFSPTECFEVLGKVDPQACVNGITEAMLEANEEARMTAAADQELERRTIAYLISQANILDEIADDIEVGGLDATTGATVWQIPVSHWTASLMIDLDCLIKDCELVDPKLVFGRAWRKQLMKAAAANPAYAAQNCDDACHMYDSLFGSIRSIANHDEFDTLFGANTGMLLIDNAKIGFYNSYDPAFNSRTPAYQGDGDNTHYYHSLSRKLSWNLNGSSTPVRYDRVWKRICISEGQWQIKMKLKARFGYFCYPDGCEGNPNKKVIRIEQQK